MQNDKTEHPPSNRTRIITRYELFQYSKESRFSLSLTFFMAVDDNAHRLKFARWNLGASNGK